MAHTLNNKQLNRYKMYDQDQFHKIACIHMCILFTSKTVVKFLDWLTGSLFLTEDVNLGLVQYVLNDEKIQETMDSFQFLVKDSKPNMVSDNIFHIQWSLISFEYTR